MNGRVPRVVNCPACDTSRTIQAFPHEFVSPSRKCASCASRAVLSTFGPLADESAVYRIAAGDPPERSNVHERRAAIRLLQRRGLNQREIADRTKLSTATVSRLLRPTR